MSFAFRALLYSLALSLSFNCSILTLPQAAASTPSPPQSSEYEQALTLQQKALVLFDAAASQLGREEARDCHV